MPASYGPTVSKPSFGPRQARPDGTLEGLARLEAVGFPSKNFYHDNGEIFTIFNRRYVFMLGFFGQIMYVCFPETYIFVLEAVRQILKENQVSCSKL